ncbi:MAG: NAD(P) transhydrogenase subunit alpha [Nitrospinae bacterium]|nr:NAD(P) transhydrogenase subunit alpha [Nitrospinota bacterium]
MLLDSILASNILVGAEGAAELSPFMLGLIVFVLACFVGYHVIWNVTPALHTPLMAVTNAISGIIIVGALLIVASETGKWVEILGFFGVLLASVNVFGGFVVTNRMLAMFKKQKR